MPPKATVKPSSWLVVGKTEEEKKKANKIIMPPKATKKTQTKEVYGPVMPSKTSVVQVKKTTPVLPGVKQASIEDTFSGLC